MIALFPAARPATGADRNHCSGALALALAILAWPLAARAADAPSPPPASGAQAASRYPLERAHLFAPFWKSRTVYGESVALEKSGPEKNADGTLLFTPAKVLRVRGSDGATEYREGVDFTVDAAGRRLVLTPGSAIPSIERAALYKRKGDPQSIGRKIDDPETYLFYAERWFPRVQVEVDYERAEDWAGYTPAFAGAALSRTVAKLKRGQGLRLCVTGDSISTGANASKTVAPYMPPYVTLLQKGLEQVYGGAVSVSNLAVPGTTAKGGVDKVGLVVAEKPDLVVIAFGMNDTAGHHADHYQAQLKAIIAGVRAALPEAEFVIVTSTLANPEWSWSPATEFPKYREAALGLAAPGVAVADLTALWTDMLKRKRYLDLTGNGINHPNDFGHRLHAEVLLELLVDPAAATKAGLSR